MMPVANETAVACVGLVARHGARMMSLRVAAGKAGVGLTSEEFSAVSAKGFTVEWPNPLAEELRRLASGGCRRGPKVIPIVASGQMARAILEYRNLPARQIGDQLRIAEKYGINRNTFATYLRNPKRIEECLKFAQ